MKQVCPSDKSKFTGHCFTCNGIGHRAQVCPSNPQQGNPKSGTNRSPNENQPQVTTQPVPLMGVQMTGTSLPMNMQPSLIQPYTLSVQPSYLTVMTSGNQQVQQPRPVGVSGAISDGVQLGNNRQQMAQQGQVTAQSSGGLTGSSGSGGGVGPQPQGTN